MNHIFFRRLSCWIGSLLLIACSSGDNNAFVNTSSSSSATPQTQNILDSLTPDDSLSHFAKTQQSDIQVLVQGKVTQILSDDQKGTPHQRFIIELSTGQTLLIAHNIELAPRVENLRTNTTILVYGEYEWNQQGGVIHWTHHDPNQQHEDGWIEYQGKKYQ